VKIPQDTVPVDLDDAVLALTAAFTEADRSLLDAATNAASLHLSLGMVCRHYWSLWDPSTHLVQWFVQNFGISHGDDISDMIIAAFLAQYRGEPFDPGEYVKRFERRCV
jgi:hypothetical protein